ncbi:MAG: electron transfer flavoprotein subunit beta/FixA family protein [Chloroflexi bacterium]|nr:electron transfer flavoprotein subunit beta/FixA family protein [Chloroflexota bacterium]
MKILVPTKRVPDTDQKIRVKPDGSGIETDGLPYGINPFDAIALEEALRLRERLAEPVEVVAVGLGTLEYEKQLRSALAMGADRALLILCPQPLDPWNVARLLQAVVRREHPRLVLMGKQAVDDDANQTGQFLAALLDWPQATFASQVVSLGDGLLVDRETDAGIERVRVKLPAVVTTDLRLNEPRYASIPSIMKARKKPIETIPFQELGVTLEPRVEVLRFEAPPPRRAGVRVKDVDELLRRLHEEAKVI